MRSERIKRVGPTRLGSISGTVPTWYGWCRRRGGEERGSVFFSVTVFLSKARGSQRRKRRHGLDDTFHCPDLDLTPPGRKRLGGHGFAVVSGYGAIHCRHVRYEEPEGKVVLNFVLYAMD
ncbi:hypothetical protein VNO77_36443 [Canavalia gladiata]|uniref:Uncharacterized protein n=1 Tax=Canavalia gladiata TaxID=3824 RepID=A0AAN9PW87_CANGL